MPELNILKGPDGKATALGDDICQFLHSSPLPAIDDSVSSDEQIAAARSLIKPWRGSQVESALWLVVGELDRSHSVSQNDSSAEGSFWHGIMHRREGDYSNAKYWFNRAGEIDAISLMTDSMALEIELIDDSRDGKRFSPTKFVDEVKAEASRISTNAIGDQTEAKLKKISFYELISVFDWCFVAANQQ